MITFLQSDRNIFGMKIIIFTKKQSSMLFLHKIIFNLYYFYCDNKNEIENLVSTSFFEFQDFFAIFFNGVLQKI